MSDRVQLKRPVHTGDTQPAQSIFTPIKPSFIPMNQLTQTPLLGHDFSRISIQPKLTVSQPDDPYEREADRVADEVMRMSDPMMSGGGVMRSPQDIIRRKCDACEDEEEVQAKLVDSVVQRKPMVMRSADEESSVGDNIESRLSSSKGGGSALSDEVRSFMEPRFGADFSQVRVHTGSEAVQMNQGLNAQAFAHRQDIYFGRGKAPAKDALTAHELTHIVQQTSGQVQPFLQRKEENNAALATIQGLAMYDLLPKLQALPDETRKDQEAGSFVGGSRLVTAMHVVQSKGIPWIDFAATHNGELSALPVDQIGDIISFLGAPKDARYFKADQFDGRFDGAVDPTAGVVTLFFRVKFEVAGARFGAAQPGTPAWEKETKDGLQQYKTDYKRVVEEIWSNKGIVRPAFPIGKLTSLQTKVVVTIVESGEHKLIHILSDVGGGRSNMGEEGNQQVSDNQPKTETSQVVDSTGRKPEQVTNTRTTSAHEFGHAIGLKHPHCPSGEDKCYGVTAEERRDVMGGGSKLQVIKQGDKVLHDDFAAFERIAERWGKDILPGALAQSNKWSAG